MQRVVLPGSTIGVLGSGQLGRMFALKARRMGYRVHTYSPDTDSPTGHVSDEEWVGPYEDMDLVRNFAKRVDVITYEFENIPSATIEKAAEYAPVRPNDAVLHTVQNRLREKTFLDKNGFPCAPYADVRSLDELVAALITVGCPAVLKTAGWGYDGKGQVKINHESEAEAAWKKVEGADCVLESFINFSHEASVVAARSLDGEFSHFGLMENQHVDHILDVTLCPGRLPEHVAHEAIEITRGIVEAIDLVGVLCVEFFVKEDHSLLVNEIAPRVHNSGHVTFDNCTTSQFEQQLRAVCGLPLGDATILRPAVMVNLLGDLWAKGEPDWAAALAFPSVKLHLYGKTEARPGRKMGHLTAMADSIDTALDQALKAREALTAQH